MEISFWEAARRTQDGEEFITILNGVRYVLRKIDGGGFNIFSLGGYNPLNIGLGDLSRLTFSKVNLAKPITEERSYRIKKEDMVFSLGNEVLVKEYGQKFKLMSVKKFCECCGEAKSPETLWIKEISELPDPWKIISMSPEEVETYFIKMMMNNFSDFDKIINLSKAILEYLSERIKPDFRNALSGVIESLEMQRDNHVQS